MVPMVDGWVEDGGWRKSERRGSVVASETMNAFISGWKEYGELGRVGWVV